MNLKSNGLILVFLLFFAGSVSAQSLSEQLNNVFTEVLELELVGSPGQHGNHFRVANNASSAATINSFSNFITANISSFPLSSTTAGVTFDFSEGVPKKTTTSLGPLFTERAQTIGRNRINMGFNFSYFNLAKVRGVSTEDIRFSFTHQDVNNSGILGDVPAEVDNIDLFMNLDVNATILAFLMTYGVTNRLDVGVAVPYVSVQMKSDPRAEMISITGAIAGQNGTLNPLHHWGSASLPELTLNPTPIDDDATGIGDVAFRAKYNFVRDAAMDFSGLVEYRLASGDEENFLGVGDPSVKVQLIGSAIKGNFAPHINIAYEYRGSDLDRNEIELFVGYDQKISDQFTLAVDFLGEFEIGDQIDELAFPDAQEIRVDIGDPTNFWVREISPTNIPNRESDNILNASVGFKFSPKDNMVMLANTFVPLNDGGLRSDFVSTFGFEFSF
ncbi:MAG: hypothetical protein ACRBF0_02925 [Calditrichia bacterium]